MKTWWCPWCHEELNLNMVQQGGLHVGCYDAWYNHEIDVWRVEHDGTSFADADINSVMGTIENMEPGEVFKISKVRIKQGVFELLPEFEGF